MATKEMIRTDKQYEEQYLREVTDVVQENIVRYTADTDRMRAELDEMMVRFHDDNPELWQVMENTDTMYKAEMSALGKCRRAVTKPYFGRILFTGESGEKESLYIGRGGISKDAKHQLVADWRAPISNAYYENGLGECTFRTPDGDYITIDLSLKRTFDIADGKLTGYFDSEAAANDELLNKYLARNKQAVLSEIIATIQKEQNDIIRRTPLRNVIVQGAAGSGKTTVAMHRISYILYNYADRISPKEFCIIGSNTMLLNYITGVLPELDVEGIRQMTMEELFITLLYEQWDSRRCTVTDLNREDLRIAAKGKASYFDAVRKFCERLEKEQIKCDDLILDPVMFTEGIKDGVPGVYDRTGGVQSSKAKVIMRGDTIARFLEENPAMSIQNKILTLNERLHDNVEQELAHRDISYTAKEKKAIRAYFKDRFGRSEYQISVFDLYDRFLAEDGAAAGVYSEVPEAAELRTDTELKNKRHKKSYDVYDLAALAYIYKRVNEVEQISEAHHIVIDEAQDYGMMAYKVLKACMRECNYTIMGDVSQNIRYDFGINDWQELRDLILDTEGDAFCTLRKSYRNTIEISEFATRILDHGTFEIYPSEPIIRHGKEPVLKKVSSKDYISAIVAQCEAWQAEGQDTIAVVLRNEEEARKLRTRLSKVMELLPSEPDNAEFGKGVMVLSVAMTKGLEFDSVLIADPTRELFPSDDRNVKLLYVAATRALHELAIIYCGDLTGLIADPIPEGGGKRVIVTEAPEDRGKLRELSRADIELMERDKEDVKGDILAKRSSEKLGGGVTDRAAALVGGTAKKRADESAGAVQGTAGCGDGDRESAGDNSRTDRGANDGGAADRYKEADRDESGTEDAAISKYGATVAPSFLQTAGHAAVISQIKWIMKQPDGIYMQSRYGVLRITLISEEVVRISFSKDSNFATDKTALVRKYNMYKGAMIKDNGKLVEITTKKLKLVVDKGNGNISYKDAVNREILHERNIEPRYIEEKGAYARCFMSFTVRSDDTFRSYNPADEKTSYIRNASKFIKPDGDAPAMIIAKDCAGIVIPSRGDTIFSHTPANGALLITEEKVCDFFFVLGGDPSATIKLYKKLSE